MSNNSTYKKALLQQYITGNITAADKTVLLKLLTEEKDTEEWQSLIAELSNEQQLFHTYYNKADWEPVVQKILNNKQETQSTTLKVRFHNPILRKWYWTAAVIIIICLSSYFVFFRTDNIRPQLGIDAPASNDVLAPDKTKAHITLADGSMVYIDSMGKGELAQQGNVQLLKLPDGQIAYTLANGEISKKIQYNTLHNPRGSRVIDIQLVDGSRVWLNAGSSISYPVVFIGNERKVTITGEVYFEVAPDKTKPFYVGKANMEVQVLGTHFNVNAYDDEEDIKVTLLEGLVNVKNEQGSTFLKPGEQGIVSYSGLSQSHVRKSIRVKNVDTEQIMAWKNGLFSFDNADLATVMRDIARWYDIEVRYAGKIPAGRFKGKIPRDLTLMQLLNGLTSTRIRFHVENNRRVTILPE